MQIEIGLIADMVLPEPGLPQTDLAFAPSGRVHPTVALPNRNWRGEPRAAHAHGEPRLYRVPSGRKASNSRRQGPHCMHMVWQDHEGIDARRPLIAGLHDRGHASDRPLAATLPHSAARVRRRKRYVRRWRRGEGNWAWLNPAAHWLTIPWRGPSLRATQGALNEPQICVSRSLTPAQFASTCISFTVSFAGMQRQRMPPLPKRIGRG